MTVNTTYGSLIISVRAPRKRSIFLKKIAACAVNALQNQNGIAIVHTALFLNYPSRFF